MSVQAGSHGVRFVFYAAKSTKEEIVSYGPFIADTQAEIANLYQQYQNRKMKHIAAAPYEQKLIL